MEATLLQISMAARVVEDWKQREWPQKTAYHIHRMSRKFKPELAELDRQRLAIFKKFGTRIAPKNPGDQEGYEVPNDQMGNHTPFGHAMQELSDIVVNVNVTPLTADMLGGREIKPAELDLLGPFFTQPESDEDDEDAERVIAPLIADKYAAPAPRPVLQEAPQELTAAIQAAAAQEAAATPVATPGGHQSVALNPSDALATALNEAAAPAASEAASELPVAADCGNAAVDYQRAALNQA